MPDKYNKDLSIEVLVGLFMFIILIALGVFTIVLSRQNFLAKKYPLTVMFNEIGGLREGDHVFLRGMQVGIINSTHLEDDHVLVRTELNTPIQFREGYKVEIMDASMLGGKIMKIYKGSSLSDPIPVDEPIRGEVPIDILEELGIAVTGMREMSEEVEAGKGTLGKLLNDEDMYDQLRGVLKNLNKVSDELTQGEGLLSRLVNEDSAIYDDLKASVSNLREISEKISEGEGTLGKLLEDDGLFDEAQALLEELRAAIDDLRETSPVTTFGTVLFGAF